MGFHQIAKYYYYPGWHEPGAHWNCIVNKSKFDSLPSDLKEIIRTAAARSNSWMMAEFNSKNMVYLDKILQEGKVDLRSFPDEVLGTLREYTSEVLNELVAENDDCRKIYQSFDKFRRDIALWSSLSEKTYYQKLMTS